MREVQLAPLARQGPGRPIDNLRSRQATTTTILTCRASDITEKQLDADDEYTDTKTRKSTKTIRLHPEELALLTDWRAVQEEPRERSGESWSDRDLMVATRHRTAVDQSNHRRSIREARPAPMRAGTWSVSIGTTRSVQDDSGYQFGGIEFP